MERVLERLGRPQGKIGRSVHIAGTNGKGSTLAYLRSIGAAHIEAGKGWSVNSYTSPHLVRFNERISVHGAPIGDRELIRALDAVETANAGEPLSFFEATTAAMFVAFAERPADLTLIEVGLGGRFDATNVFTPDVSVITPVARDHAEFLGDTIEAVAGEKAGVIKPGVPVVIGPQDVAARDVLLTESENQGAPAIVWGRDFRAFAQRGRLVFETQNAVLDLPMPALHGAHQVINAGVAIAAARTLGVSGAAMEKGLSTASWPARMQALKPQGPGGPFAEIVAESGGELWLDGGHNPHAARALATFMAERESVSPRPLILVMGMLANKDAGAFLDAFSGLAAGVSTVGIPGHESWSPEDLAALAKARGMVPTIAGNLTDAVQRAVNMGEALSREEVSEPIIPPRVLICGSLYLAGLVLAQDGRVPQKRA